MGRLSLKLGKFGAFIGCANYPNCRYTRPLGLEGDDEAAAAETALGTDPASTLPVTVKKGPFGHYIQLGGGDGGEKPKRVALPRPLKPADVDLDTALRLLALPRELGHHPETGEAIVAGIGRFGPYIKHGKAFKSLAADDDVLTIGLNRAVVLLAEPAAERRRGAPQPLRQLGPHPEGGVVALYQGRYGPYVSHDGVFATLPKAADPEAFPLEAAIALLAERRAASPRRQRKATKPAAAKAASRKPAKPAQKAAKPSAAAKPEAASAAAAKRNAAPKRAAAAKTRPAARTAKKPRRRAGVQPG